MKDFRVLKILDKFKWIFLKLGIDYHIMRRLLQIKLIMDGRRTPTVASGELGKKAEGNNNFLKSLWMYALIGLIMIPLVVFGQNYIFQMGFVFGIMMFMVMTSLISDFSSVLLDIRDKNIVLSKPVSSKTLSFAKTIHIFIYMFFITLALTGPALIAALLRHGILFFALFLFQIILIDLFIIVLTALMYLLILRFFDGEKLKDIINYVQIALSIAITVGYQLIGRLFSFTEMGINFVPRWWQYFIIPMWFAAPFQLLIKGDFNIMYVILTILTVVVPLISIMLYVKLIPSFERNLQKLSRNDSVNGPKVNKGFINKILKVICKNREERIFYRFTIDMLKNERDFKLKVYPSLGFAMIFPFLFMINSLRDRGLQGIASSKLYFNIYLCALFIPSVVLMIKYSGKFKGAWIYKVLPINKTASIFKGALKALIVKLLIPLLTAESAIFIFIFGVRIIPDLILVLLTSLLFSVICFKCVKRAMPFSLPFEEAAKGEGMVALPLMALLGIFAAIHFGATFLTGGIYIYMVILLLANIIAWKLSF